MWENNAYSWKTNKDNFTKFYMQVYWSIPQLLYFMNFDFRRQIWGQNCKTKISNSNNSRTMQDIKSKFCMWFHWSIFQTFYVIWQKLLLSLIITLHIFVLFVILRFLEAFLFLFFLRAELINIFPSVWVKEMWRT